MDECLIVHFICPVPIAPVECVSGMTGMLYKADALPTASSYTSSTHTRTRTRALFVRWSAYQDLTNTQQDSLTIFSANLHQDHNNLTLGSIEHISSVYMLTHLCSTFISMGQCITQIGREILKNNKKKTSKEYL